MTMEENRKSIRMLLESTERPHMKGLLDYLEENGFFEAPCSGGNHLACVGGLAEHSFNVFMIMTAMLSVLLEESECFEMRDSVAICALLHDVGKMGDYNKPNYVPNMIKDGRPTKAEPEQKYKQSEDKPFKTNPELLYIPHEVRSISIIKQYIDLTEEEEFAILYHNGLYGDFKYVISGKETPLYLLLHSADMWASRVVEPKIKMDCGLPFVTVGKE